MSTLTLERVLDTISAVGVPLENVFLIAEDEEDFGEIVVWYPEIGLRSMIIENDELYRSCFTHLREAGVRRFRSWDELVEAQRNEKWKGWDTCSDYRRH